MQDLLPRSEVFDGIPSEGVTQLLGESRRRTFRAGSQLIRQGDVGDAMFVILHGRVRVERSHPSLTVPLVLAELGRGEIVGEMGILDSNPRAATVTAVEQTEALEVTAEALGRLLAHYPVASRRILELLTRRLRSTNDLLEAIARRHSAAAAVEGLKRG